MAATISLTVRFNLDTGKFLFTDTSNYAAQISPDTGVKGCLKITGPGGLVYANAAFATPISATADITTAGVFLNSSINFPIDASGNARAGVYTIEYSVYVTGGTDAGQTFTMTPVSFNYTFVKPVVSITQTSDCINAILTSTDSTNYVVNNVTPSNVVTHTLVEVANPTRTTISNSNTINTVTFPNLYNGAYKTTISTVSTYNLTTYSVVGTLTGTATYNVSCIASCDIYCGIKAVEASYANNLAIGDVRASENDKSKIALLSSYNVLYTLAVSCQKPLEAASYMAKIQAIGNFSGSCCTSTGQVIPVSGSTANTTYSASKGIVASTVQNQTGATAFVSTFNRVETANLNDAGIVLPAKIGNVMYVNNAAANSIQVFPAVGEQFRTGAGALLAANVSIAIPVNQGVQLVCYENAIWTRNMTYSF